MLPHSVPINQTLTVKYPEDECTRLNDLFSVTKTKFNLQSAKPFNMVDNPFVSDSRLTQGAKSKTVVTPYADRQTDRLLTDTVGLGCHNRPTAAAAVLNIAADTEIVRGHRKRVESRPLTQCTAAQQLQQIICSSTISYQSTTSLGSPANGRRGPKFANETDFQHEMYPFFSHLFKSTNQNLLLKLVFLKMSYCIAYTKNKIS